MISEGYNWLVMDSICSNAANCSVWQIFYYFKQEVKNVKSIKKCHNFLICFATQKHSIQRIVQGVQILKTIFARQVLIISKLAPFTKRLFKNTQLPIFLKTFFYPFWQVAALV